MRSFPLTNINILSREQMLRIGASKAQVELLESLTPLKSITELLHHNEIGRDLFRTALHHGLVAGTRDVELYPSSTLEGGIEILLTEDTQKIPDCSSVRTESVSADGKAQQRVQRRSRPDEATAKTTPDEWKKAQEAAENAAQERARQNRKLSIANLLDKYKCDDSNCPDLVLKIKLDNPQQTFSQGYTEYFQNTDTWRERGWEAGYVATATVIVSCGKVA